MFSEPAPAALAQKRHCHLHGGLCTRRFDLLEWFDSNMRPSITFNNCVFVTNLFHLKFFWKLLEDCVWLSADHHVLISIWWENVKYLHCDGHDHDNAKENDAVFKTGPNCRWWQEGEDMHHTRGRPRPLPNWPFLLQIVLMLEFLKKGLLVEF